MAALGLGGVGALALKALGVSLAALTLAAIVGLKKLTEGGGDGGHQVHYVCIPSAPINFSTATNQMVF